MNRIFKHVDWEVPGFGELAQGPTVWPAYRELVLSLNPYAYWRLGETSGPTAHDEAGGGDGTFISGGPTLGVAGALVRDDDAAMGFGGPGHIALPAGWGVYGAQPRTVVGWCRYAAVSSYKSILSWGSPGSGAMFRIEPNDGNGGRRGALQADSYGGKASGSQDLRDGLWHQFAVVLSGDNIADTTFYIDGALDPPSHTDNRVIDTVDTGETPRLGANVNNPARVFPGDLDELAVFERALAATEVQQLYHRGLGRFQRGASL